MYTKLVLSSGSHKGLFHIGALYYLKKHTNIINTITDLYGTSVGSINILLISLPIDIEYVINYITNRPWHKCFNLSITDIIKNVGKKKGVLTHDLFDDIITPLFDFCNIDINITFQEFYELTNKSLHIYATNVNTIENYICDKTHTPNMPIIEAIKMSCSIPFIFEPYFYDNNYYIDGFIYSNHPLYYAKKHVLENYIQNRSNITENSFENYCEQNKILSLSFDYTEKFDFYTIKNTYENTNIIDISSITISLNKYDNLHKIKQVNTTDTLFTYINKLQGKFCNRIEIYENNIRLSKLKELYNICITDSSNITHHEIHSENDIYHKYVVQLTFPAKESHDYAIETIYDKVSRKILIELGYNIIKAYSQQIV